VSALPSSLSRLDPTPQSLDLAVLVADLPGVRVCDVDTALTLAAGHPRAFVADHRGTGTTLPAGAAALRPRFGSGSTL
jgi:2-phospho-L-lactate guanylyltransferase